MARIKARSLPFGFVVVRFPDLAFKPRNWRFYFQRSVLPNGHKFWNLSLFHFTLFSSDERALFILDRLMEMNKNKQ